MTLYNIIEEVRLHFPQTPPAYVAQQVNKIQTRLLADQGGAVLAVKTITDTTIVEVDYTDIDTNVTSVDRVEFRDADGIIPSACAYRNDPIAEKIYFMDDTGAFLTSWPTNATSLVIYYRKKPTGFVMSGDPVAYVPEIPEEFHDYFVEYIVAQLCSAEKNYRGAESHALNAKIIELNLKRYINRRVQ